MPRAVHVVALIVLVMLFAGAGASAAGPPVWRVYAHHAGTFVALYRAVDAPIARPSSTQTCPPADLPSTWHVLNALQTDLTHDGAPECVLLVWRPWQDWPIMQWSDSRSPIAANRDARGDSAHIILVESTADRRALGPDEQQPPGYRELWAGSALALPITRIAAGDVDGDGREELVALEGDYSSGRYGAACHVAVWRWNGFGFTLQWRSPPQRFVALALADLDGDGSVEILVR
jgi:hypothetical protein